MDPLLLRRRSGRTAAAVLAFGFGGGTLILGIGSVVAQSLRGGSLWGAVSGYAIGALPFFLLAAVVAPCKSELWFVPDLKVFRLLTYRPWRRQPLIEDARLEEYAGIRTDALSEEDGGGVMVSLVTPDSEAVPVRQFSDLSEAQTFVEKLGEASGLWIRHTESPT